MTLLTSIVLAGLAALNWRHSRSLLYPPVLFCLIWAGVLMALVFSGDDFYRLSALTPATCVLGCLSFSAGAMTVTSRRDRFKRWQTRPGKQDKLMLRTVDALFVILVCLFPTYWNTLANIGEGSSAPNLLQAVRTAMVAGATGQPTGLGAFNYVLAFALVMTLIVATESCRLGLSKWRLVLWMTLTLAYYIPTGSRLGAMVAIVAVFFIFSFVGKRISLRNTLICAIAILLVFSVAAIALGKGGNRYSSLLDNTQGIGNSLQLYTLGGLVAFDQLLQNPTDPPGQIQSFRFFYAVAGALGFPSSVPNIILPNVPTPKLTNVYSVFYNYLWDFGWAGMCTAFLALGAAFAHLYRSAANGRPEAVALLGLGCGYLVFTCSGDPFLIGLSACIQAALQVLLVYNLPRLFRRGAFAHPVAMASAR